MLRRRWSCVALILTSVTGCGINTRGIKPQADACAVLPIITFSRDDTVETQDMIVDYLIVLDTLCPDTTK